MELNLTFLIIIGAIIIIILAFLYIPFGFWYEATRSGVRISIIDLIFMRLRKSPVREIVEGLIVSAKGGLDLNKHEIEALGLSGGNIRNVVDGMVAAKQAGLILTFKNAIKADSQGIDITNAVKENMDNQLEKEFKFE